MYFEDSLVLSNGLEKSLIGATYCVLAINKPYFLNPILVSGPGVVLTMCIVISFVIQFYICFYRNIQVVFASYAAKMFPDYVIHILNFGAFLFSLIKMTDITNVAHARRFSISTLSWHQTPEEQLSILSMVVYASMLGLMFYGLAMFDLIYQLIYVKRDKDDISPTPLRRIMSHIAYLSCDIIYCLLMIVPSINGSFRILHSLITVYGTCIWPTISLFIYSQHQLSFRIFLMIRISQLSGPDGRNVRAESRMRFP